MKDTVTCSKPWPSLQTGDIASLADDQPVSKYHPNYRSLHNVLETSTVTEEYLSATSKE